MTPDHPGTMSVLGVRALAAALAAATDERTAGATLRAAGIAPEALADPEGRIDLRHAFAFFTATCAATGDPHFGIRAAPLVPAGSMEALEYALRSCATIGDALRALARYYAVVDDRAAVHVEVSAATFSVIYTPPPQLPTPRTAKEFLFAYLLHRGAAFTDAPLAVHELRFRHPPPPDAARQAALFRAPVHYGASDDALVLSRATAELPMRARDPLLTDVLGRVLERALAAVRPPATVEVALLDDVVACIGRLLPQGAPSLDEVAAALATSGRTLQRRLREAGTRYSDLVASVQRDLAHAYLRDAALSVGEVAYLVGFADTTSFHRAFRRWTGHTPAALRRGAIGNDNGALGHGRDPPDCV